MSDAQGNARGHVENIVELLGRLNALESDIRALPDAEVFAFDGQEEIDDVERELDELPLCVEVRSGWQAVGESMVSAYQSLCPAEFSILLTTGGPACRIVGDLDDHNMPATATLEHQDWGTPWTRQPVSPTEFDALLTFAQRFYYGEA